MHLQTGGGNLQFFKKYVGCSRLRLPARCRLRTLQLQTADTPQAGAAVGTLHLAMSDGLVWRVVVTKFGARQEAWSSTAVGLVILLQA